MLLMPGTSLKQFQNESLILTDLYNVQDRSQEAVRGGIYHRA